MTATSDPEACAVCTPALHPAGDAGHRLSEAHVGVRFGDGGAGWSVHLNDGDVTDLCVEAMAGEHGWALLYVPLEPGNTRDIEIHCGPEAHAVVAAFGGNVRITRRPRR